MRTYVQLRYIGFPEMKLNTGRFRRRGWPIPIVCRNVLLEGGGRKKRADVAPVGPGRVRAREGMGAALFPWESLR